MVVIDKDSLKLMTLLFIERLDESSPTYAQASDIILTMLGISDGKGNLTQEYRDSEFWVGGVDGEPLRPSARADIAAMLPAYLRPMVRADRKEVLRYVDDGR